MDKRTDDADRRVIVMVSASRRDRRATSVSRTIAPLEQPHRRHRVARGAIPRVPVGRALPPLPVSTPRTPRRAAESLSSCRAGAIPRAHVGTAADFVSTPRTSRRAADHRVARERSRVPTWAPLRISSRLRAHPDVLPIIVSRGSDSACPRGHRCGFRLDSAHIPTCCRIAALIVSRGSDSACPREHRCGFRFDHGYMLCWLHVAACGCGA